MNILITSVGRRTKLVQYLKNHFDRVVATDMSPVAPAIYEADGYYLVPEIHSEEYILSLINICQKEKISGVLSVIDPELHLLSKNREKFKEIGVEIIGSDNKIAEICFDKWRMYNFLEKNGFNTAKTYIDLKEFALDFKLNRIKFPVFIKPISGSASIGINRVDNMKDLELLWGMASEKMLIQEYMDGQEIGVDVYSDMITGEIISIFTKEKISMRAGETDKARSFRDKKLFELIKDFVRLLGTKGPIDIDIFRVKGEYYISEVNPRFGGGYVMAYECGEKFPEYIRNNLANKKNVESIGNYRENVFMMKCDEVKMIEGIL